MNASAKADAPARSEAARQLYEADEYAWIEQQIAALRDGRLHDVDREHLAEYLSDMAARDRRELGSRFAVLLQHLLKVRVQPSKISRTWLSTIAEQQDEIRSIFHETPSIRQEAERLFTEAYRRAIRKASAETRMPPAKFPAKPPWTMEEALIVTVEMPDRSAGARRNSRT